MPPPAPTRGGEQLALTILYHPNATRVGERALLGDRVELSRTGPVFDTGPLDDRYVSRSPITIVRAGDGVTIDGGAARGAANGRPLVGGASAAWQAFDRQALGRGVVLELADRVVLLLHSIDPAIRRAPRAGLVGGSDAIEHVRADIARVADLDVPVLLRGETGSGKELVARAIHQAGAASRPFVGVNIAAVPPSTAASELFGHSKGAFTGAAHDHVGLFERADGGTLFLDEIGEAPDDVQPMLLRVLETSEVTPLGSSRSRKVRVRLIAATDADLETQISEQGFRAALFHRLAGYQLLIPSLRDRRDDIGRLLIHFLREELATTGDLAKLDGQRDAQRLWLPAALVGRLCRYGWPGNVRQLRNAARQLAISSRGADEVRVDAALEKLLAVTPAAPPSSPAPEPRKDPNAITDDELVAALRTNGWRAAGAATQLGISRSTLYQLIDRSKRIRKAKDIPEAELRKVYDACSGDLDAASAVAPARSSRELGRVDRALPRACAAGSRRAGRGRARHAGAIATLAGRRGRGCDRVWRLRHVARDSRRCTRDATPYRSEHAHGCRTREAPARRPDRARRQGPAEPWRAALALDLYDALSTTDLPILAFDGGQTWEMPGGTGFVLAEQPDPSAAAWKLDGVDAVVRSKSRRGADKLYVDVTIERRERAVESFTVERSSKQAGFLVHDLASQIAAKLGARTPRQPRDAAALDIALYERYGRGLIALYLTDNWKEKPTKLAELDRDHPELHRAGARLAMMLTVFAGHRDTRQEVFAWLERGEKVSDRILASDPEDPIALVARGIALRVRYEWAASERVLRRAREIAPNHARVTLELTTTLNLQGKLSEGIPLSLEVIDANPLSTNAMIGRAWAYFYGRRYDDLMRFAPTALDKLDDEQKAQLRAFQAMAAIELARFEEAYEIAKKLPADQPYWQANAVGIFAASNHRDEAIALRAQIGDNAGPALAASMDDALGRTDAALTHLERLVESHNLEAAWLRIERYSTTLRSHPRFQALMKKVFP